MGHRREAKKHAKHKTRDAHILIQRRQTIAVLEHIIRAV
jgi:hypothetical protein